MAKVIKTVIKLQLEAGKANPAPPVGTALGPHGVNIAEFCKQFNDETKGMTGDVVPAEITIFVDRSFTFKLKTPPVASLLKKAAGIEKGAANPLTGKVGKVTRADVRAIAERKMIDLNTDNVEAAMRIVEGTARSSGIDGDAALSARARQQIALAPLQLVQHGQETGPHGLLLGYAQNSIAVAPPRDIHHGPRPARDVGIYPGLKILWQQIGEMQ